MQGKRVTVFGGTGFIGRSLIQRLAHEGAIIQVPVRDISRALFLKTLGHVGQITLLKINIHNEKEIQSCCLHSNFIINLIGTLTETRKSTFRKIHVDVAKTISECASRVNAQCLLQISSLNASPKAKSTYAQTKYLGEEAVLKAFPQATILRPSLVYGPHDRFLNILSEISRFSFMLPLFGGGKTQIQPLYVGDLVDALITALRQSNTQGKIYDLGGPKVYSLKEIYKVLLTSIGHNRILVPIPYFIAQIFGFICEFFPNPILTRDQVKILKEDLIVKKNSLTFKELGIIPNPIHSILPKYLSRYQINQD